MKNTNEGRNFFSTYSFKSISKESKWNNSLIDEKKIQH